MLASEIAEVVPPDVLFADARMTAAALSGLGAVPRVTCKIANSVRVDPVAIDSVLIGVYVDDSRTLGVSSVVKNGPAAAIRSSAD